MIHNKWGENMNHLVNLAVCNKRNKVLAVNTKRDTGDCKQTKKKGTIVFVEQKNNTIPIGLLTQTDIGSSKKGNIKKKETAKTNESHISTKWTSPGQR